MKLSKCTLTIFTPLTDWFENGMLQHVLGRERADIFLQHFLCPTSSYCPACKHKIAMAAIRAVTSRRAKTCSIKLLRKKNIVFSKNNVYLCPKMYLCTKRLRKIIVPPMEMLLSFSIGTFLTNYDVINRKL